MKIIGVTGPSGSGKSTLGKYLSEYGIPIINADEVYHSMLTPPSECLDAIRASFGNAFFLENGELDRSSLAAHVFGDKEKLELLNQAVLGSVINRIKEYIAELSLEGAKAVIVDAPTLIESGFHNECHVVVSVLSDKALRVDRISSRDSLSDEKATERISAQKDDEFYISNSDFVIYNDSNEADFKEEIAALSRHIGIL